MLFDIDVWQEIFSTIRKNKLRTFLTGFSVAVAIFMLVILLGSTRGLKNGVEKSFTQESSNAMTVQGWRTTKAYKGQNSGRNIEVNNKDFNELGKRIAQIDAIAGRTYIPGDESISYKTKFGSFRVRPTHAAYKELIKYTLLNGRMMDTEDERLRRKIAVISDKVKSSLFKNVDAIGKYIEINNTKFKVVGVFNKSGRNDGDNGTIYIPITVGEILYNTKGELTEIGFTLGSVNLMESQNIEKKLRYILAKNHNFDPTDKSAVWVSNNIEQSKNFVNTFGAIESGIWFIGIFTLILGAIGVFNIMLIVVKERTKEIGVRKALGAKPSSIVGLILLEAVFITAVSGYIGMFMGISLLEIITSFDLIQRFSPSIANFFLNPQVDMGVAISATIVLVITGGIAGYIPARRASKIKPVDALRDE
ncbi:MAG: ABC transporter permease [Marinifilaceae bacterium]